MTDAWNPAQYERFRDERSQPFFDLAALVRARPGMTVADLGCGTGELTLWLHEHLSAAQTLGLDSSPAMLERCADVKAPGLRFECGDIVDVSAPPRFDSIFSNAALQWLPDHERLLAGLAEALAPHGQLAIQVPANFDQPTHVVAAELAREEPFAAALGGRESGDWPVLPPESYARLLHDLGFGEQHVALRVYTHLLASRDEVVEWVKGTGLSRWRRHLSPDLAALFLERYRERLLPRLPDTRPHFFPFKRILLWGQR